jgi:2-phospho-L-lactate/phosphoenolpyruvate guanylyltransferase
MCDFKSAWPVRPARAFFRIAQMTYEMGGVWLEAAILARSDIWAVVPVKDLQGAKQRLADVLSAKERQELFAAMLEDVLCALAASAGLRGILVVTRDPLGQHLAARYGARVLVEQANRGHTAASSLGARTLTQEGVGSMVQVPADLPLLSPDDIAALLGVHGPAPAVTLGPARDERGTNAVVCSPPDLLPLRFGDDSFLPHVRCARSLGIEPQIVRRAALALDIDTPADLATFLAAPSDTLAWTYLSECGISARLELELCTRATARPSTRKIKPQERFE